MFKKTITAALALMCAMSLSAQDTAKHYLIFDLGGGLHNIAFSTDGYGTKKMGMGYGAQVGYRYFFNPNWGVGIGAGYNTFSALANLNYNADEQEGIDDKILTEHKERNFHTEYRDIEEKVTISAIDIPIGVYYKTQLNPKWVLGAGATAIVSPIAAKKYKNNSGDIRVVATYPYYDDKAIVQDVPTHHLSNYSGFDGTPDFKSISFGVGGEVRAYYAINKKIDISMGVSGAYRFSDIKNANYDRLYNEDAESYVGVTQTAYCSGVKLVNVTASVGIRVKFLPKVLPVPTPEIVDVYPDYVFIDEDIDIVVKEESIRIDRIADDYGINLMPSGYNYVSNALDMSAQLRRKKVGDPIGAPILFASGSARLANTDNTIMDTVAVFLKENPDVKKLEVSAHTDNMGADAYNLNLSKRRAQTVANYLIKQGVAASRLSIVGYGESRPLNNNETPEERERNRRVEFMILELSE